jgi:hypothetical protein
MSRELVFLPQVSRDFIDVFNYDEALSPGRGGARFEAALKEALQKVEAGVITHLRVFEHFHRVMLRDFPYNLYCRLVQDRAVIPAALYTRFDPKRMERVLKKRR